MRKVAAILSNVSAEIETSDTITLDCDERTRRRAWLTTDSGERILLDMARAVRLRDGDVLELREGGAVRVRAAAEALVEITASSADLIRIAWHLGNRHLPTQIAPDVLRIRPDHVLEHMVEGLGGACRKVSAPFDPEGGAYDSGAEAVSGHAHSHGHSSHHDAG